VPGGEQMFTIVQAARRHVPVAILSNTTSALAADLRLHGLSGAFDAVFTSAALGVAKPAPAAYLAVAAALGTRPGRIYFTDDEMIHVRGARHAGLMAGQFTCPGQLSATLAGLGLPLAAACSTAA
jgi:putative hydrolase of the HAD superfamily